MTSITTTPVKSTKPKRHYVNNAEFLQALIAYKAKIKENEEKGLSPPRVPNYIGECLYNIANRLSLKGNFVNYSYREEMISDGIENCLIYLNNFNPEKSDNPFAYFTQIIYFAFLRRIQKERKQLYVKHKVLEREVMHSGLIEQQTDDIASFSPSVKLNGDFMNTFVDDFETKLATKKTASKEARAKKLQEIANEGK